MKSFEKLKTAHEIKHLVIPNCKYPLSFQFKAAGYTNLVVKDFFSIGRNGN